MAKLSIKAGSESVSLLLFIQDNTSTTGAGKTGLAYNTGSLTCYYVRPGSAAAAVSLVTQTVTGAWASGGFVEIDSTNMPGFYRFDIPNAALAAGVRSVAVLLKGATGMAPLPLEIDLGAEVDVVKIGGQTVTCAAGVTVLASVGTAATSTAQTGDSYAIVNSGTYGNAAIKGYVDDIGVAGAGLTALGDTRLANLDATVSSRSTYAGADTAGTTTLLGRIVGTLAAGTHNAQSGDAYARLGAPAGASVSADIAAVKSDTDDIGLAGAGLTAVPWNPAWDAEVQSEATDALNAYDPPTTAEMEARTLVAANYATASSVSTLTGYVDTEVASILAAVDTEVAAIKAKTDNLPASPAAVGSAMTLTLAYDAAKTAASQTSVDDLPTNAELATALAGADDAVLAAISGLNNLSQAQAQTAAAAALTAYDPPTKAELDSAVSPLATATSISALNNLSSAQAQSAASAALTAYGAAVQTSVNDLEGRLTATRAGYLDNLSGGAVATAAALSTVGGYVDTEVAAIKAVTDKLDTTMEIDGAVYRFTTNALEQSPAGGGGGNTDWTSGEREQIRYRLNLDGTQTAPASVTPPAANVTAVKDAALTESAAGRLAAALSKLLDVEKPVLTAASVNQSGDAHARLGAPTGASVSADVAALTGYVDTEVAAILAAVDTEVAAIKAKTDNLPASPAAVGSAMALTSAYDAAKTAATQTSVDDLPTNAELAAALQRLIEQALAAIADVPTVAEFEARTLPAADYTVVSDLPSVPSAASIADAVWDEAIAGHAGTGSTGAALAAAGAAGDPWATELPGAYGAGTAGALLSGIDSSVDEAAIADAVLSAMDAAPPAVNVTYWKGGVAPAMTGDAFARLGAPAGASVSVDIAAIPTAAEIDTQLSGTHGAGAWGASSGASSVTYTATVDGAPTAGVYCRMTTDAAGLVNIAAGTTNALGQVTFLHDLPSGTTVYLWRSLAGVEFANPDIEVIP